MTIHAIRANDMLRDALGSFVTDLLNDEKTMDVLLNTDGRLWLVQLGRGRVDTGKRISPGDADTALRCIADHIGIPLTRASPILSGVLPVTGERVAGAIAPVTTGSTLAIRKHARGVFPLNAFPNTDEEIADAAEKVSSAAYSGLPSRVAAAARAIDARRFVLLAGMPGSGKTTLLNSLLALPSVINDRVGIIEEDASEIQVNSPDNVRLLSMRLGTVSVHQLVVLALRLRLDRLILGEVRTGPAALEMVDAANTGHDGGICTIHANSAKDALDRLAGLCGREMKRDPFKDVARAVKCVVFAQRTGQIREVIHVDGYENGEFITRSAE